METKIIPTAEELSKKYTRLRSAVALKDLSDFAIEFAKLHLAAQANAIYNKGISDLTTWSGNPYSGEGSEELDEKKILSVYPLDLVK